MKGEDIRSPHPEMIIVRRHEPTTMLHFGGGVKLALPETYLKGQTGIDTEYRKCRVLSVPDRVRELEPEIVPGALVLVHELNHIPVNLGNDPMVQRIPLEHVLCVIQEDSQSKTEDESSSLDKA